MVLFLFPVCKNGGVGINLFFLLCTVQVLQRVKGAGFLAKCAFSALKTQIAIYGKKHRYQQVLVVLFLFYIVGLVGVGINFVFLLCTV